jgi:GTPase SAR1 family protein
MPSPTLSTIIGDLDQLYDAYHKGRLISDDADSELARKLGGGGEDIFRFRREFLLLDALVRNRIGRLLGDDDGLRHVVVFGGNNVGKSTIINILAGGSIASVSPEGGHTRHAQAFRQCGRTERAALFAGNSYAFRRLKRSTPEGLAQAPLDRYGVSPLVSDVLPPNVVLWDTPDCDAVGSASYLLSVIEAVAAADVLIYVTTSQKYAVEHLVEWFLLLHSIGIDILECLNRTATRDHQKVIESQRTRILPKAAKHLGLPVPKPLVVGLKHMVEGEDEDLWDPAKHPEAVKLRETVLSLLEQRDPSGAAAGTLAFVNAHIDRMLEPARIEAEAIAGWDLEVEKAIGEFAKIYEAEYLTSDKVIEPISRLNVDILELLNPDIPGLKQALNALSWVARWPSRLTIKAAKHVYRVVMEGTQSDARKAPAELIAYKDAHEHVLNTLSKAIASARSAPRHHPFWDALDAAWKDEFDSLNERFAELVAQHMKETDRAIKQAARAILQYLKTRPTLLRTLQSVKVAANVGGIAAAFMIPHAGSYVYDLLEESVLAPAMGVGVDMVAQGAIATYVTTCKMNLIAKLRNDAARNAIDLYREPVRRIAQVAKTKAGTLGVDEELLRRLPEELRRLEGELDALPRRTA